MYTMAMYLLMIIFFYIAYKRMKYRRSEWVLLLIILIFVKSCIMYLFEGTTVFTVINIGGTSIHLDDIVCGWLLIYIISEISRRKNYNAKSIFLLFSLIIPNIFSLIRGTIDGYTGGVMYLANIRKYMFFIIAILAFYLIGTKERTPEQYWKWRKLLGKVMNVVIAYTLVIWILDIAFGINSFPGQSNGLLSDGGSTFRIIHPMQSLVIAMYAAFCVYEDLCKRGFIRIRSILLTAIVILLQWRTVVAAFLVATLLSIWQSFRIRKKISMKFFIQIIFITLTIAVIVLLSKDNQILAMIENLFSSFKNVSNSTGTFNTRVIVWNEILGNLSGIDKWFGRPYGTGYGSNVTWTASAHSGYVDYIVVTGYVGVVLLIIFMLYLIVTSIRKKESFIGISILALCVFWYAYGFSIEQGAYLGFVLSYLQCAERKGLKR